MRAMHGPFKNKYDYCNQIEREQLSTIGPIWVYWLGEENVYFTAINTGIWHYCKCL